MRYSALSVWCGSYFVVLFLSHNRLCYNIEFVFELLTLLFQKLVITGKTLWYVCHLLFYSISVVRLFPIHCVYNPVLIIMALLMLQSSELARLIFQYLLPLF